MRYVEVRLRSSDFASRAIGQILEDTSFRELVAGRQVCVTRGTYEKLDEYGMRSFWSKATISGELADVVAEYPTEGDGKPFIRFTYYEDQQDEWVAVWRFLTHVQSITDQARVVLAFKRPADADKWRAYFGSSGKGSCIEVDLIQAQHLFEILAQLDDAFRERRCELAQAALTLASKHFAGELARFVADSLSETSDYVYAANLSAPSL